MVHLTGWQDLWWRGFCSCLLIISGQLVVPVVNVINIIIKSTATEEAPSEGEVLYLMSTYHILSVRARDRIHGV